ncbi:hypothetical protein [Peribacillus glennii]|uniref:Gram-positive pilin subunit D1 N-terminal domain-containing protein n=1 Tax=Peribacillus glennii TaxID=2303991 RepID=A0A372LG50_9BACI|nr:hypothetical protein [Peribacillus glennii]RFU65049.1 hypothetical protein D0466_03810 [Peribacillus glennii]
MKRVLMLLAAVMLLVVGTASAEEAKPILDSGKLKVAYDNGVNVSEEITIANAEAIQKGALLHTVSKIDGGQAENLVFESNGQELQYERKEGKSVDKVTVSLPDGIKGNFTYKISYKNPNAEAEKIPFVIPAVNSAGNGNVVSLTVNLPEGKYLHESFPIIDSGDTGTLKEHMMNIPSYVGLETGSSPAGLFTRSNLYTFLGLAVILGIIAAWLISERKSKAGEAVNV